MATAVELKGEWGSEKFRQLPAKAKDGNQARRLLALAAIRDGKSRAESARIGGMDRQTMRDWVHALNARGLDGQCNRVNRLLTRRLGFESIASPDSAWGTRWIRRLHLTRRLLF